MKRLPGLLVALLLALPGFAQQSTSYKITDRSFNAGGHPDGGTVLSSTSYRVTLDSIGDSVVTPGLGSTSYNMDGSFPVCYPPPGEVLGLSFLDAETLVWNPERSVGDYNVYRGPLPERIDDALPPPSPFPGYGTCWRQGVATNTTIDDEPMPSFEGHFYLVTAANRLDEEGTKGLDSDDSERHGGVCP